MKRIWMVLTLVCLLALVAGCGGGRGTNPVPVQVSGRIVDAGSLPLKGAAVTIGSGAAISDKDGLFALTVNSGSARLTVSKSGFDSVDRNITVSAPGPMSLGDIRLTQRIPAAGGPYTDGSVTIPDIANGVSFSITASADHPAYLAVFPQAEQAGDYTYALTVTSQAKNLPQTERKWEGSRHRTSRSSIGRGVVRENHRVDDYLRQKERESVRHRYELLAGLNRARFSVLREQIGDKRTFNAIDFTTNKIVEVPATLRRVGVHANFYVDNRIAVPAALDEWGAFFDSHQPDLASTFGRELDVDGNGKIIVLVTPIPVSSGTVFGYFLSDNEIPKSTPGYSHSNEADMIVINPVAGHEQKLKGTLAHEYQHLLHYSERITNGEAVGEAWITEAFSTLAEDLVGYGYLSSRTESNGNPVNNVRVYSVQDWLDHYYIWSLVEWDSEDYNYGGAYLFARYVYDQYGASKVLEINRSAYGGTRAVTDAVGGTFGDLFRSWVVAMLNEYQANISPDPRLNYGEQFQFDPTHSVPVWFIPDSNATLAAGVQLRQWGVDLILTLSNATITPSGLPAEANYGGVVVNY